jgi:hypothetical protein
MAVMTATKNLNNIFALGKYAAATAVQREKFREQCACG